MSYQEQLDSGLVVVSTAAEHAEQLEALQRTVFLTLDPAERFRAEHYRHHVKLFPEGQFVVVDGDRVVGMTSAIRLDRDLERMAGHTFAEVFAGGWLTSHDPDGAWLCGADVGTHPRYRRRGIARALYRARHDTVRRLGLRGQVTVGLMNGYGEVRREMSPAQYHRRLLAGELEDPTVSAQMHIGFEPRALVRDYVDDPRCGNCGVLLVLAAERDV